MTGIGWLDATLTVLGVLGGGGTVAALITRRVRPVVTMPELLKGVHDDLALSDARVSKLEVRVTHLERGEKLRDDYIFALRRHIADGAPPPPPPWPAELIQ